MPINPLYEFVDENLAPAEAFLQYWRNRDQGQAIQPIAGGRGILEQPVYSLQANQPQMGAAPRVPALPRRNPAQTAIRRVNAMSPMGGEQLPEMQFNEYQEPQRNIEGLGGLGQWDELPMGGAALPEAPTPPPNILGADPGMYEEIEPRRLDEVNLPMTETKGRQQPLTTLMEPSGPIEEPQQQPAIDERLAQTTLGRQAVAQGWDPRRMYAALAEFAGGVGNIRGRPTPSTSGKYYERMYSEEEKQRENDAKMEEMRLRFEPKPQTESQQLDAKYKQALIDRLTQKPIEQAQESDADRLNRLAVEKLRAEARIAVEKERQGKPVKVAISPDQVQRSFKNATELRKEYQNHATTKATRDMQTQWDKVRSVFESPSPAGDMSMIFLFMKGLDPNSTVREGEYKTAAEATNALGRVETYAQNIQSGLKLNPEQRADFKNVMEKYYRAQMKSQARVDSEYKALAERSGINPQDLMIGTEQTEQAKPTVKSINDLLK